jgi:O-antigen/teichoic acid export membrane protein
MTPARRSRFVSNTAALGVSTAASTVLTLVQVKLLAAYLSQDLFGLFAALRGLSLLVSMLASNGLPQLLVRFLPVHESRGQVRRATILSALCVAVSALATAVLLTGVHLMRGTFLSAVPEAVREGPFLFWFYATTLGVTLKLVLYGGLGGLRRFSSQTWLETVSLLVQVGWVFALRDRLDLATLFMILGTVSLAGVVVGLPWLARHLRRDVGHAEAPSQPATGYGSYWLGAAGLSLVALAFTDVDRYVLSGVLALEVLSLFHIASRVVRLCNRFIGIPVLAFQPEVSRVDAEGRQDAVEFSTRVFLKFNVVISVFAAFTIAAFSGEIIRAIASVDYLGARPLLLLLSVSIPLTALTAPLTAVMKSRDQVRHAFYCDLAWAVSYIVLLVLMGKRFGLLGAGYAHVAACTIQLALAVRLSRLGVGRAAIHALTRVVLVCILAFAAVVAVQWLPASPTLALGLKLLLLVVGVVVFRRGVLALAVFDADEHRRLNEMLGSSAPGRLVGRLLS